MTGRFVRDDRGAALVEFALVAPLTILVLVACLDFARALNAYVIMSNASREGARYASVHPAAAPVEIATIVAARIAPLDPGPLVVTATYDNGLGAQAWPVGGIPPSVPVAAPLIVRVTASYPWQASTWLIGSFIGASGSRTFGSASLEEIVR